MSKVISVLLILLTFALPQFAFGRAGTGGATAGFKDPRSTTGLCTPDNKEQSYWKEGYCKSLQEMFDNKPCVTELIEKIRQRYVAKGKLYDKMKEKKDMSMSGLVCDTQDGSSGIYTVAEDPKAFKYLLMQFFAGIIINESDWDVLNKEKGGEPQGLMNLKLKDMDDPKYECGCRVTNSSGQEGVTVKGDSPGPLDGHHSIMCGAYMALYWAEKDGTLFDGSTQKLDDKGKPTAKGASRIFKSMEDNSSDGKMTPQIKLVTGKLKQFCEKNPGKTNKWSYPESEVGPEDLKDSKATR